MVPSLIILFKVIRSSAERSKLYSAGLESLLLENEKMNVSTPITSSGEAMLPALILNVIINDGSIVIRVKVYSTETGFRRAAISAIVATVEKIFIMYCLSRNGGKQII